MEQKLTVKNGENAYFEELYTHFHAIWLNNFAQEMFSTYHFNTVFNNLWTDYKRDHTRRQKGTIHAWEACNLYTPIVLIFGPDDNIIPEILYRTDLLVKYQDLATLAASSVSDINDLVQLQKIVLPCRHFLTTDLIRITESNWPTEST